MTDNKLISRASTILSLSLSTLKIVFLPSPSLTRSHSATSSVLLLNFSIFLSLLLVTDKQAFFHVDSSREEIEFAQSGGSHHHRQVNLHGSIVHFGVTLPCQACQR